MLIAFSGACAASLPQHPEERALYRDLAVLVAFSDSAGWGVDRFELEEILPEGLHSICLTQPETRDGLERWLIAEIDRMGGPAERAYQENGGDIDAIDDLLELTRIHNLLTLGSQSTEDCPFWMRPMEPFLGRQISDDRFLISAGGGGKGALVAQGDRVDVNFGGAGRLLLGYAFGDVWSVFSGLEAGASASFPAGADQPRGALEIGFDFVLPVVVRYRFVNSFAEVEAGYLFRFTETNVDLEHGFHLGASFGALATRQLFFFPGAAITVSYERSFPALLEPLDSLKVGFRLVIDLNL